MFRYFGFAWEPASVEQAAAARRLDESIFHTAEWQPACANQGLRVYVTGSRQGENGVYTLPRRRGVVLGRLFRRRDTAVAAKDIQMSNSEGERILQTDGRALLDEHWGRYIAAFRSERGATLLLRDPSGTLPCYRIDIEGVTCFFSWLEDLIAFTSGIPTPRIDWDAVAARMLLGYLGGGRTALAGVTEILPGHLADLRNDAVDTTSLWSAVALARARRDDVTAVATAQLRQTVRHCADAWASCYETILLRLSGGLDSAILLANLAKGQPNTTLTCLNYHSPGSDSDERGFARLAASRAGVKLIERERDDAFRLESVLQVSRMPSPEIYLGRLGAAHVDAEVAAAIDAPAIFTGCGGDQLFFQLQCAWPAADYLKARGMDAGFIRASLDAARLGRVSLLRAMWRALMDSRSHPSAMPEAAQWTGLASRASLESGRYLDRYLHPDLLDAKDLPIGKFHQVQALIHPVGYYDPYLREAAPELVNPLLSQPLIELCLTLPTWLLTRGGRDRALARRAFADDIPREIAARHSKGGMSEHVSALLHRNLAWVRSLLFDGHLMKHGLIDRKKVEAALGSHMTARGATLIDIHDCIAIEAWLQSASDSARLRAA